MMEYLGCGIFGVWNKDGTMMNGVPVALARDRKSPLVTKVILTYAHEIDLFSLCIMFESIYHTTVTSKVILFKECVHLETK